MDFFPNELTEEILLHSSYKTLLSYCSTSRSAYNFCSDPNFWRRKFKEAGLPFPTVLPKTPSAWLKKFKTNEEDLLRANLVLDNLTKGETLLIKLWLLSSIDFLNLSRINLDFIYSSWLNETSHPEALLTKEGENSFLLVLLDEVSSVKILISRKEALSLLFRFFNQEPETWGIAASILNEKGYSLPLP